MKTVNAEIRCSFCNSFIGTKTIVVPEIIANKKDIITHGICKDCYHEQLEILNKIKMEGE